MINNTYQKEYIKVYAVFNTNGYVIPKSFLYSDGNIYKIDKVKNMERKASTKVGGSGIRYTVLIQGEEKYIFRDEDKWYIEAKII